MRRFGETPTISIQTLNSLIINKTLYVSELVDLSEPNFKGTLSSKVSYEVMCLGTGVTSCGAHAVKTAMNWIRVRDR